MYRYIAYYASDNQYEYFKTFKEAEGWLQEFYQEDGSGYGFSQETIDGRDYIAEITHTSHFNVTDKKENYKWNENARGFFIDGDEKKDEWTNIDHVEVGEIELKPSNDAHESQKKR